jgi:hypothetical protein
MALQANGAHIIETKTKGHSEEGTGFQLLIA